METDRLIKQKLSKKIGNAIKFYRVKNDISQETLAFEVGVDRTYIGALEQGAKCGSVYCLYLISQKLNVELKELMDFKI